MKRFGPGLLILALYLILHGQPHALADAAAWQPLSSPTGGSVAALAMSPDYANDRMVFAGLRGRGVYRSIDGGETWQPAGLSDQAIVDLAISPAYAIDHTLFAGAGLSPAGFNIYRSTDGGATWQTHDVTPYTYSFKSLIGLSISPDFASDHTLYALNGTETYQSSDGGLVYVKAGGWFASHTITHLALSPGYNVDHPLFTAVQNDQLYKSTDGGAGGRLSSNPAARSPGRPRDPHRPGADQWARFFGSRSAETNLRPGGHR